VLALVDQAWTALPWTEQAGEASDFVGVFVAAVAFDLVGGTEGLDKVACLDPHLPRAPHAYEPGSSLNYPPISACSQPVLGFRLQRQQQPPQPPPQYLLCEVFHEADLCRVV